MTLDDAPVLPLQEVVARRVAALQSQYLSGTSTAVAQLAALRAAATAQPGADPRTWELTVAGISPGARSDDPTRAEAAAHAALTLFALHQQSRSAPMHRAGHPLGRAVWELGERDNGRNRNAVRRRFEVLGTSATWAELVHHLRGLIRQLRSAEVALDYGAVAFDLLQWRYPERVGSVRLRWARDYHRGPPRATSSSPPSSPQE